MFTARSFKNQFSIDLNNCNEDEFDGVTVNAMRFELFISSLNQKINEGNNKLLEEFKDEDEDVAWSMYNQFHVYNSLNYFSDSVLKAFVISIFSFFELKLKQFSEICEKQEFTTKKISDFKKTQKKVVSSIEKYNSFLISEVIPELSQLDSDFNELIIWKDLRNLIVHNNSILKNHNIDLTTLKSIKIEYDKLKIVDNNDVLRFILLVEGYLEGIVYLINQKYNLCEYTRIE